MGNETKKKILIVEDDNVLRDMLSDQLGREYDIVQAGSGEKGLKDILEYQPDLVLLDILLPNLTGFELLEQVRNNPNPKIANVKVIIFSNLFTGEDLERAKKLKVTDYLFKANTNINELPKIIEEKLNQPETKQD